MKNLLHLLQIEKGMKDLLFKWDYTTGTIINVEREKDTNISAYGGGGYVSGNEVEFNEIHAYTTTNENTRIWLKDDGGNEFQENIPGDVSVRESHKIIIVNIEGFNTKKAKNTDDYKSLGNYYYKVFNLTTDIETTITSIETLSEKFYNKTGGDFEFSFPITTGTLLSIVLLFTKPIWSLVIFIITILIAFEAGRLNKKRKKDIQNKVIAISNKADECIYSMIQDGLFFSSKEIQSFELKQKKEENSESFCPQCHTQLTGSEKFCIHCGANLSNNVKKCPHCNQENALTSKFCQACGKKLI